MNDNLLLEIKNLHVSAVKNNEYLPIVKGVTLEVPRGKIIGLVGESGCGKSMTAKSINGLLPSSVKISSGNIIWHDDMAGQIDLASLSEKKLRKLCGSRIGMIFQEPMTSLNPMMKVGEQISEVLQIHGLAKNKNDAKSRVIAMLDEVGIANPEARYNSYPHELSGGMRQRVMIAMAVICNPSLLIADEATTALDVHTEAQILKLIKNMCDAHSMSAVVITHNMDVVAELCDYVYVMYMGRIIEHTDVKSLFECPSHPYTRGLLSSIPHIGANPEYLPTIPGNIPELGKEPKGCDFCLRCSDDERICFFEKPKERQITEKHFVSCHTVASLE